jgi:hypothetical protein
MALINTTTTGVLGTTIFGDGSGTLTVQENGVTINQISSTGLLNGRLTSMTSQASTSNTSIDFTSIPSWVKRITVRFNGVSLSGSSNFLVQIGSGSVTTSGYVSSSGITRATTGLWTSSTAGFVGYAGAAAYTHSGHFNITNISSNIWVCSHAYGDSGADTMVGGGNVTLSGTLDRVRITTVNGTDTFDAGSINILYE